MSTSDSPPLLVLVTGLPGAGKTSVGQTLSECLAIPFLSKDAFKERIFDTLGWNDKAWSRRVSEASHRILDYIVEEELKTGRSLIIESNFKPEIDNARFQKFQRRFGVVGVQVLCWADGDVLFERYWARHETTRHPGHIESATPEEQRRDLAVGKCQPLQLGGPVIELDTTDFAKIDYPSLAQTIDDARTQRARP
jgi:predicted kinase